MTNVRQWRKRSGLTQVEAAALLGVSQPYLSLLENGTRSVTPALGERMKSASGGVAPETPDERFRSQLRALGYPGFAHLPKTRSKARPDAVLAAVLRQSDVDSRVVGALPWIVGANLRQLDFSGLVRQAKLRNFQNRLGFILQLAGADTPEAHLAIRDLERARLLQEDTLCWDSMPAATRQWMRGNRSRLARHWNILTRLRAEDLHHAA